MTKDALSLALRHHQAGRLAEAERIYRRILIWTSKLLGPLLRATNINLSLLRWQSIMRPICLGVMFSASISG